MMQVRGEKRANSKRCQTPDLKLQDNEGDRTKEQRDQIKNQRYETWGKVAKIQSLTMFVMAKGGIQEEQINRAGT